MGFNTQPVQNGFTVEREKLILLYRTANCYHLFVDYKHRAYPNMLKVIRQNAGYTQRQIARLLGHCTSNALCEWEQERAMPNGTNLIKLCILYGKTPKELYPEYHHRIQQHFTEL